VILKKQSEILLPKELEKYKTRSKDKSNLNLYISHRNQTHLDKLKRIEQLDNTKHCSPTRKGKAAGLIKLKEPGLKQRYIKSI